MKILIFLISFYITSKVLDTNASRKYSKEDKLYDLCEQYIHSYSMHSSAIDDSIKKQMRQVLEEEQEN